MAMMFSLTATYTMAASTENLTVTFESDEGTTGTYPGASSGAIYTTTNGLLVKPSQNFWVSIDDIAYAEGVGVGGSGALRVCADTLSASSKYRGPALMTKAVEVSDTKGAVLSYKVKFNEFNVNLITQYEAVEILRMCGLTMENTTTYINQSQDLAAFSVSKTKNDGKLKAYVRITGNAKSYDINLDEWYTVVYRVSGAGTTKDVKLYILNEDNTICFAESGTRTHSSYTENTNVHLWPATVVNGTNSAVMDGDGVTVKPVADFYIDDLSLTTYDTAQTVGIDTFNTSIKSGATDVAVNESFHIVFDQEISEASTISLYKTGDANKTPVAFTKMNETFNSFDISVENLAGNTSYTLDFSGVKSAGDKDFDASNTITFTTVDIQYLEEVEVKQVAGEAAVTIEADQAAITPVESMFELYKGTEKNNKVEAVPVIECIDTNKCKISYTGLTAGETYTLDYSGLNSVDENEFAEDEKANKVITFTVPVPEIGISNETISYADTTITATVNSTTARNQDFYAAIYESGINGKLLYVSKLANKALGVGNTSISFTLDKAYSSGKIKIFAFDSKLVPQMIPGEKSISEN